jgi:DNA polymerase-3 subunit beta
VKFTATKTHLANALAVAARVATTSSAIQAAQGALIDATGTGALVSATDFDTSITLPLVTEGIDAPGRVLLPARLLLDVVKACPAATVTISLAEDSPARIESGSARFDLRPLRIEDFPTLPKPDPSTMSKLPLPPFIAAIDRVADSASRDEFRPVLTGVNIRVSGTRLRAVATDSYRLAVYQAELDAPASREFQHTLPARALQELAKLSKVAGAEHLTISEAGTNFVMQFASITLSTRTITGDYPNADQLIPTDCESSFSYPADTLNETIRRVALLCQNNTPAVLSFNGAGLECHADAHDIGSAAEIVGDIEHDGPPFTIGINPNFLTQALAQYGSDTVEMRFVSPLRPVMLTDGAGRLSQILMPIRLNTPSGV